MVTLKNIVDIAHSMSKQCIAIDIDREDLYQKAIKLGVDAMEGPYVAAKLTTKAHSSGYLQSNFFRLLMAITQEEPDVVEIEQIISVDATLTYGLLKMVNSCYFAARREVTSVRQAIVIMGLSELRQWAYLLSASNAENPIEEGAEELCACPLCGPILQQPDELCPAHAHLQAGRLSDGYVFYPQLPHRCSAGRNSCPDPSASGDQRRFAGAQGQCGMLYDLAISYDRADWSRIDQLEGELGIPTTFLPVFTSTAWRK